MQGKEMARSGAYDSPAAELLCLLLDVMTVRCLIAYAHRVQAAAAVSLNEASSLLAPYQSMMENNQIQDASPLHRVMFLHALAGIEWMRYLQRQGRQTKVDDPASLQLAAIGDSKLGDYLRRALTIGREAGLWNQLGKIALDYPGPVIKLATEEGLRPYGDSSGVIAFRLCREREYCPDTLSAM